MVIVRSVLFLLPAGKKIGTAQLAGKKEHLKKNEIFKLVHFYDFHTQLTFHNTNKHFLENKL